MSRLDAVINGCKDRGGDCGCLRGCEAQKIIDVNQATVRAAIKPLAKQRDMLDSQQKRLTTKLPQIKEGVKIDPPEGYKAEVYFDTDEAHFYYINEDDVTLDQPWPFTEDYVYPSDVERLGINWES